MNAQQSRIRLAARPDWAAVETVWVSEVAPGLFRIDNVPAFTDGIAMGDVVTIVAPDDNGPPWFHSIHTSGGDSTYRVACASPELEDEFERAVEDLLSAGARTERHGRGFVAVDAQSGVLTAVRSVLEDGYRRGVWYYEPGVVRDATTV